jgi:CRP/FNR family cyclic AMP-dependent transcriptional regulator
MRFHAVTHGVDDARRPLKVLAADPDLAAQLHGARRVEAAERLVARTLYSRTGTLPDSFFGLSGPNGLGLLLLDGIIARELLLSDNISIELLGAGDLVQECRADDPGRLVRSQVRWTVIEPARFAVLTSGFAARMTAYPEINATLMARLVERSHRVGVTLAIAQLNGVDRRALALFWHLAERWGRITGAGVELPLRLPHRIIAQLTQLTARGAIARREDGGWILRGEPVGMPSEEVSRIIELRRRRVRDGGIPMTAPTSVAAGPRRRAVAGSGGLAGVDERGRRRELDETETLQDRPALWRGVDLQVAEAPG